MDQVLLHLCAMIFFFLMLEGQHRKCAFPGAKSNGLAERLVALLPHFISADLSGGVAGGVDDAGGVSAQRAGVVCPDNVGAVMRRTVLVMDAALREVCKSVFGVGQLAEGEWKSWHWKLAIEMVVAGVGDPAEHI